MIFNVVPDTNSSHEVHTSRFELGAWD